MISGAFIGRLFPDGEDGVPLDRLLSAVERMRASGTYDGGPVRLLYSNYEIVNEWKRRPELNVSLEAFRDLDFGAKWVQAQRLQGDARTFALEVLADWVGPNTMMMFTNFSDLTFQDLT